MIRQDWSTLKKLMFAKTAAGGAAAIEATATGNPLIFLTDLVKPLKSLLIPFAPKQTGSGDPSPINVRNIVPWEGLTVKHGGKNLLEHEIGATKQSNGVAYAVLQDHGVSCKGTADGGTSYGIDSKGVQLKTGKYAFSVTGAVNMKTVFVKDNAYWFEINGSGSSAKNLTADATVYCYMSVANGTEVDETVYVQIEVGETATTYEEYKPITDTDIVFPSPVYGGTLDVVSGVMTVTHKILDTVWSAGETSGEFTNVIRKVFIFDDVLTGSNAKTRICNIAKYSVNYSSDTVHYYIGTTGGHGVAYVFLPVDTPADTPIQVCEELVTPITIQLTPSQMTALVGDNTIWSDADGSMTAIYLKKG